MAEPGNVRRSTRQSGVGVLAERGVNISRDFVSSRAKPIAESRRSSLGVNSPAPVNATQLGTPRRGGATPCNSSALASQVYTEPTVTQKPQNVPLKVSAHAPALVLQGTAQCAQEVLNCIEPAGSLSVEEFFGSEDFTKDVAGAYTKEQVCAAYFDWRVHQSP